MYIHHYRSKHAYFVIQISALLFFLCAPSAFSEQKSNLPVSPTHTRFIPKNAPMGWNAWNTFRCNVSEELIRSAADRIVSLGLKDAGYDYIIMDDCWMGGRDENGRLKNNKTFPSGIKALADYIHAKGLKVGIYETTNTKTCAVIWDNFPEEVGVGSLGFEELDAQTFVEWEVDFLKFDYCKGPEERDSFFRMRDALAASGRDIFYNVNLDFPGTGGWNVSRIAHSARVWGDINATLEAVLAQISYSNRLAGHALPGYWNDMDMMEVGNLATSGQNRINQGMWAIMNSPMVIGADLSKISKETLDILENKEIIAIQKDSLNLQARMVREDRPGHQVWARPLASAGERAVALLNITDTPAEITVTWSDLVLREGTFPIRDLWAKRDIPPQKDHYTVTVPAQDIVMLKISGSEISLPSGTVSLLSAKPIYQANTTGTLGINSVAHQNGTSEAAPLSVGGRKFETGFNTDAPSQLVFALNGTCSVFSAQVGIDDSLKQQKDAKGQGSAVFEIWGDEHLLAQSTALTEGMSAVPLKADIKGVSALRLVARGQDTINTSSHADWLEPTVTCAP